jgi:predicted ribonuclease YlaK
MVNELYQRNNAYDIFKEKNVVRFNTTSFLRGMTFNNSLMMIEEAQNMATSELYTILTRVGNNSKIIITGDWKQADLREY